MQEGQIKRRGASWVLRYYESVLQDGKVRRRRVIKRLAACSEYKTADHQELRAKAAEILAPINVNNGQPTSVDRLAHYLEHVYLPHIQANKKPSTYKTTCDMWKIVKPHLNGLVMRSVRPRHIDQILKDVADAKLRSHSTLLNVKSFLSGAMRHAVLKDLIEANPVMQVRGVPKKSKAKGDTYAYSLDEVQKILGALTGTTKTAVAVAAFTGLRKSEIMGLQWADLMNGELHVRRSVWWGKVSDTKTLHSAAPVPVLPILAKELKRHRATQPGAAIYIFEGDTRNPLRLENEVRRTIKPALKGKGVEWQGWHAFRRGLGTNLHALGVDDLTIQRILRHGNVATTQAHYVKTAAPVAAAALKKLEAAFTKARRKK
jgi:integrase